MDHIRRDCFSRAASNTTGYGSVEIPQYEHVHVFPRIVLSRKIRDSKSTSASTSSSPPSLPSPAKEIQIEDVLDNVGDYWMN